MACAALGLYLPLCAHATLQRDVVLGLGPNSVLQPSVSSLAELCKLTTVVCVCQAVVLLMLPALHTSM